MQNTLLRLFAVALPATQAGPLASAQIMIGKSAGFAGALANSVEETSEGAPAKT